MANCHFCKTELIPKLNFGMLPLANHYLSSLDEPERLYEGAWSWCPTCELLQLENPPSADEMFTKDYPYRTSTSQAMLKHFEDTALKLHDRYAPVTVGEVGCSDGGMIQFLRNKCAVIGFETSQACWPALADKQIQVFYGFDTDTAKDAIDLTDAKFDLLYAANTLRSIPNLEGILAVAHDSLTDDGVLVIEEPYLPAIVENCEFDQFYDENVYCFTARSMAWITSLTGFELVDVEMLPTHGGSVRYHLFKDNGYARTYPDAIRSAVEREVDLPTELDTFSDKIDGIVMDLTVTLSDLKVNKQRVVGYGATAKSSTLLATAGIRTNLLECIYDSTPSKWGKYTPMSHIPIKNADEFAQDEAEHVLLLAWNHSQEILKRENAIRPRKWLTYIPQTRWLT